MQYFGEKPSNYHYRSKPLAKVNVLGVHSIIVNGHWTITAL